MLNIYCAELLKMRRNRVFPVCGLLTAAMPVLIIFKDLFLITSTVQYLEVGIWAHEAVLVTLLLWMPLLSGFVITSMVQREYADHTVINNLTAPVSRRAFVAGKMAAVLSWYAVVSLCCWGIITLGCVLLYFQEMTPNLLLQTVIQNGESCLKSCLFGYFSFSPVFCIAVMQRKLFYPSLIACLFFVFIAAATAQMYPLLAFILPWSAVVVQILMDHPPAAGIIPILLCGLFSFLFSCAWIGKQDL